MLGQSFGAMVTIHTAMRRSNAQPRGVVLTAPFINVPRDCMLKILEAGSYPAKILVPRARLVAAAAPKLMSNIPEAVDAYTNDPLVNTANICARPGYDMNKATYWLAKNMQSFSFKLLVFPGEKDACCSFEHAKDFVARASSSVKQFRSVENGYHLLWSGPKQTEILAEIVSWIIEHA